MKTETANEIIKTITTAAPVEVHKERLRDMMDVYFLSELSEYSDKDGAYSTFLTLSEVLRVAGCSNDS